jgi:hypothetical protein
VTGPRAWQAARDGTSDPERHVVAPDLAADREALARLGARDGLRIPPVIKSIDPNGGPPRQVDVSRALSALGDQGTWGRHA